MKRSSTKQRLIGYSRTPTRGACQDDKGGWEVMIPPGQKATHVVTADDNVEYYCRFHPNMKGRIKIVS